MGAARQKGRKKGKVAAQGISDFRFGIDRVERRDGKTFVIDGQGYYAPVEVVGDEMPPNFIENLAGLSDAQVATMFEAIRLSPYISPEGKSERMTAILHSGRVRLTFEVVTRKLRPRAWQGPRKPDEAEKSTEEQIFDTAMGLGEQEHAEAG